MQTIVCQTAETFSPDLAQMTQPLQQARESDAPRKSDFLSMLNESLAKEEGVQERPRASVQDEVQAGDESQTAVVAKSDGAEAKVEEKTEKLEDGKDPKTVSKKDEPKKPGEKNAAPSTKSPEKIDAFIQGALSKLEKNGEQKPAAKNERASGAKKVAADSETKKIDPKQLDLLRSISEKSSLDKETENDFKALLLNSEEKEAALAASASSLLDGQKFVREAEDFSYVMDGKVQEQVSEQPKISSLKKDGKKSVIQVTDLRTKAEAPVQKDATKEIKKNFEMTVKETGKASVEMTLDLSDQAQKNILSLDNQSAASDGSTFQAMLKNQITQNASEFVKAGNIVLRDNNQGQINLILHPEGLGNVKITMEMNGKALVGHITVQSREAMEAFGQSADALKQAFVQNGFEDASFDVSFAGSQMQFAQGQTQDDTQGRAQKGRKIYGEFTQESLTSVQEISDNFIDDDVSVNVVA